MTRLFAAIAMVAAVAVVPVSAQAPTAAAVEPLSLGDLMTMLVQPRHIKLGLAGREKNWAYAAYELHELEESFERVVQAWPKWRAIEVGDMMTSVTSEPMAALERAIKAADLAGFTAAYGELTAACNLCHGAADLGFIVIKTPDAAAFPDQDFRPLKP